MFASGRGGSVTAGEGKEEEWTGEDGRMRREV